MKVSGITNPPFNEQIWPVLSDFVKSRFHYREIQLCIVYCRRVACRGQIIVPQVVYTVLQVGIGALFKGLIP